MGSFAVDFLLDAAYSGVLDCSVTTVDCRKSASFILWPLEGPRRELFKEDVPLNRALFAIQIPPPTSTRPPRPPKRPFGGPPPPAPPNREPRRVSSFWMRAQASLGSGADMLAVRVRGWRGVRETCRRRRWRMQLGHEVVDDEKMVVGQSRLPTAPNRQANLRIAVSRWLDPFATIFSVIRASLETFHQCRTHRSNVLAGLTSHLRWWLTRVVAVSRRIDHPINGIGRPVLSTAGHKLPHLHSVSFLPIWRRFFFSCALPSFRDTRLFLSLSIN